MKLGDVFRFADRHEGGHLWFVISDPERFPADPVVIVNATSDRPGHLDPDRDCFINPGEHPEITHRSRVRFRNARAVKPDAFAAQLEVGQLVPAGMIGKRTLCRIHFAAAISRFIPLKCVDVLRRQGLIS